MSDEPIEKSRIDFLTGVVESRTAIITGQNAALRTAADEIDSLTARIKLLEAVAEAVIPLHLSGTHIYDLDVKLRDALAALKGEQDLPAADGRCTNCHGSGRGIASTRCFVCKGSGKQPAEPVPEIFEGTKAAIDRLTTAEDRQK